MRRLVLLGGSLLFFCGVLLLIIAFVDNDPITALLLPTYTPEPIIPTPTIGPTLSQTAAAEPTPSPEATVAPPTRLVEPQPDEVDTLIDGHERFGVSGELRDVQGAVRDGLLFAHVLNWHYDSNADRLPPGVQYWLTIKVNSAGIRATPERIEQVANRRPGSIWIIGNEPDVRWQDDVTPERYAELYHEAYTLIKAADPTAKVAAGSIAQATPLRLAYLDRALDAYRNMYGTPMPADWWTLHAYVLREERDSWGIDIPAGFDDVDQGELYEIEDHDSLALFEENIVRFRRWMADNGYRSVPLAITEFGILLPNDYGFPPEEVVEYMHATFDIMLTLEDEQIGLPSDNNRLVQTWFWYMLEDTPDRYPTGNLFNSDTQQLTLLGRAFRDYQLGER